jgi:hypothetical protein
MNVCRRPLGDAGSSCGTEVRRWPFGAIFVAAPRAPSIDLLIRVVEIVLHDDRRAVRPKHRSESGRRVLPKAGKAAKKQTAE